RVRTRRGRTCRTLKLELRLLLVELARLFGVSLLVFDDRGRVLLFFELLRPQSLLLGEDLVGRLDALGLRRKTTSNQQTKTGEDHEPHGAHPIQDRQTRKANRQPCAPGQARPSSQPGSQVGDLVVLDLVKEGPMADF